MSSPQTRSVRELRMDRLRMGDDDDDDDLEVEVEAEAEDQELELVSGTPSRPSSPRPPTSRIQDEVELEAFRAAWKKDLLSRKEAPAPASAPSPAPPRPSQSPERMLSLSAPQDEELEPLISAPTALAPAPGPPKSGRTILPPIPPPTFLSSSGPSRRRIITQERKDSAVEVYARAVESEQSGKLNEALMLYRQAFKMDDDVDRAYQRSLNRLTEVESKAEDEHLRQTPKSIDIVSAAEPPDRPYSFQRHIQLQPDYHQPSATAVADAGLEHAALPYVPAQAQGVPSSSKLVHVLRPHSRPSPLTALLTSLPISPDSTSFLPADENLPMPIGLLPPELMERVFSHLDVGSLERFGSTSWRARYLTAYAGNWRRLAEGIYKGPMVAFTPAPAPAPTPRLLGERYGGEWRTALVEEERIRMDGCYISVCHYVRPGAGDQWVAITHMITYHRFLRFYPDGRVISFLTTDHPSDIVPILRSTLRAKGFHLGRWRLLPSSSPPDIQDAPSREGGGSGPGPRIIITDLFEPRSAVDPAPKYEFEMDLALRQTGRGRWNKLEIGRYSSINLRTGESEELGLKHQKPFYFSKVKSYNPAF